MPRLYAGLALAAVITAGTAFAWAQTADPHAHDAQPQPATGQAPAPSNQAPQAMQEMHQRMMQRGGMPMAQMAPVRRSTDRCRWGACSLSRRRPRRPRPRRSWRLRPDRTAFDEEPIHIED